MTQLHAHWTGKCWDNVQTKHMCQVMTKHMCVPNICVLVRKACGVYGVETRHGNCQLPLLSQLSTAELSAPGQFEPSVSGCGVCPVRDISEVYEYGYANDIERV